MHQLKHKHKQYWSIIVFSNSCECVPVANFGVPELSGNGLLGNIYSYKATLPNLQVLYSVVLTEYGVFKV